MKYKLYPLCGSNSMYFVPFANAVCNAVPLRVAISSPDWISTGNYWHALAELSDSPDLHLMMDRYS